MLHWRLHEFRIERRLLPCESDCPGEELRVLVPFRLLEQGKHCYAEGGNRLHEAETVSRGQRPCKRLPPASVLTVRAFIGAALFFYLGKWQWL